MSNKAITVSPWIWKICSNNLFFFHIDNVWENPKEPIYEHKVLSLKKLTQIMEKRHKRCRVFNSFYIKTEHILFLSSSLSSTKMFLLHLNIFYFSETCPNLVKYALGHMPSAYKQEGHSRFFLSLWEVFF